MGLLLVSKGLKKVSSPILRLLHRRGLSTAAVSWRSSPLLMLPSREVADNLKTEAEIRHMDYSFYRLADKQIVSLHNRDKTRNPIPADAFCYGASTNGWLLYGDPSDCSLLLTNPLSPVPSTIPLPPTTTLSSILVVSSCCPENGHDGVSDSPVLLAHQLNGGLLQEGPPLKKHRHLIHKFAISSSADDPDCVLMVIQIVPGELAICKPGQNSEMWLNLGMPLGPIWDVAYSPKDRLFYTLTSDDSDGGHIETWDVDRDLKQVKRNEYRKPEIKYPEFDQFEDWLRDGCSETEYLVESFGEILLVIQYRCKGTVRDNELIVYSTPMTGKYKIREDPHQPNRALRFDVYRLNESKDSWEHLKSIGDRVLFLGINERFSVSATDFPGLKPNSIYFINEGCCVVEDWGIYDLEEQTVTPHYPCHHWSKLRPRPCWIYCPDLTASINSKT